MQQDTRVPLLSREIKSVGIIFSRDAPETVFAGYLANKKKPDT
jgi:hypothetical protein